jgi:DNA-binding ferritin-like protein
VEYIDKYISINLMDKILNLSAFGDVIHHEDPNQTDREEDTTQPKLDGTEGKYAYVFKMILQNVVQTKLLHWQSHFYGQHKALDELFDGLIDKGDTLAESVMGKYGRPVLSDEQLCLKLMNYTNAEKGDLSDFMDHLYKCYAVECKSLFEQGKDSEILNIVEEIIALVDKIKYLISLR